MKYTIESERLIFRPWEKSDAPTLFNGWANNEEITKYLTWNPHKDIETTNYIIDKRIKEYDEKDRINFAIVLKENELALAAMVAGGTESTNKTASTKATIYDNIVDDIATFTKTNGHAPVAIIVSPATKALLQKSEALVRGNSEFTVNQAVIGQVGGLSVVDGIGMPTGTEYIITDGYGYLHPHALVGLELFGNIPGRVNTVALQGEWKYGSKVIKASRLLVKKSA